MSMVDFTKLFQSMSEIQQRLNGLEQGAKGEGLIPLSEFLSKRYMSAASFYQKAPRGLIVGAYKIGNRWFVDEVKFLKSVTDE
jgi:hypothetical protein